MRFCSRRSSPQSALVRGRDSSAALPSGGFIRLARARARFARGFCDESARFVRDICKVVLACTCAYAGEAHVRTRNENAGWCGHDQGWFLSDAPGWRSWQMGLLPPCSLCGPCSRVSCREPLADALRWLQCGGRGLVRRVPQRPVLHRPMDGMPCVRSSFRPYPMHRMQQLFAPLHALMEPR